MLEVLKLSDKDVLFVKLNVGDLPTFRAKKLLLDCQNRLKDVFPNNRIIIMPQSTTIDIVTPA